MGADVIRRFILAFVALSANTWCSLAADTTIGEASFTLPPPKGYCELSDKNPSDARVIQNTGAIVKNGGNQLLALSADCNQLTDWRGRARDFLDDYAQYQIGVGAITTSSPPDSLKRTCDVLRQQGNQINSSVIVGAKKAFDDVLKTMELKDSQFIGVLDEDSNTCYFGLMTRIKSEARIEKLQLVICAIVLLKAKTLFYYSFSVYQNSDTALAMLRQHKVNVSALLAANK